MPFSKNYLQLGTLIFICKLLLHELPGSALLPQLFLLLEFRIFSNAIHGTVLTSSAGAVVAPGPGIARNLLSSGELNGSTDTMARISTVFPLIYKARLEIDDQIAPFHLQSDQLVVGDIVDAINRTGLDSNLNRLIVITPLLEDSRAPVLGIHEESTLSDHGTVGTSNARHFVHVHHLRSD